MASRAAHSSSSAMSREAALTLWRGATAPEERKERATAVVANTGSYTALSKLCNNQEETDKIWADAGKKSM
ncbi:MAG: hypothetical protein ACI9H6_000436 [Patiriisocius sp.]|jgi:hypothetical protein